MMLSLFICVFAQSTFSKICENNDYHCSDRRGLEILDPEDECTEQFRVCDGFVDCPFGDDEHNCPQTYPDGWICPSDGTYIPLSWSCVDNADTLLWDCPNQDDVNSIYCLSCGNTDSNSFSCNDNGRCIPNRWICDGDYDCMDGSDEDILLCGVPSPNTRAVSLTITRTPSEAPTITPSMTPSTNTSTTPTIRPTRYPTTSPTSKPTSKLIAIGSPTKKATDAPSQNYDGNHIFMRVYISEIMDIANDMTTESAIIESLSIVLEIPQDLIMITNVASLDVDAHRRLKSKWKWGKKWRKYNNKYNNYFDHMKTKKWRKYAKYSSSDDDNDDEVAPSGFVSIDVEINTYSMEQYYDVMDCFYASKWKLYRTENSIRDNLCKTLSKSNLKVQIDKISTTPL